MVKSGLFNLQKKLHAVYPQFELKTVADVQSSDGMKVLLKQILNQFKYIKKIHQAKQIQEKKAKNVFLNNSEDEVDQEDYGQFLKMGTQVKTQRAYEKEDLKELKKNFRKDERMTNIEILEEEIEFTKNEEFQQKLAEKKYRNMLEKKQKLDEEAEKKRNRKAKIQQVMQKNLNNLTANTASNADMSQSGIESRSQNVTNRQTANQVNSIMPKYKTGDDIGPILTYLRSRIKMEQR